MLEFGDVDLVELRALIERSALFIGGDSGPLHIASTTRTPVVGIYGPTLSARSAPWRNPTPNRWRLTGCPAARAISGPARRVTFAASRESNRRRSSPPRSARSLRPTSR